MSSAVNRLPEGTLTFLMTDVKGSTQRWEGDAETMGRALELHDGILSRTIAEHGGVQVEAGREGDSVLAVFQAAAGAASCAVELQRRLLAAEWPGGAALAVRVALHTGEAHLRGDHYYGSALNRCARVLELCHGGQVLVTRATRELVADAPPDQAELWDLGLHKLRDLRRAEHVFQLADAQNPVAFPPLASERRARSNLPAELSSFVGRTAELSELESLLGGTRLLTLAGPGGAGKTRLAIELARGQLPAHPDGVWLVELAPISDPLLVPRAVSLTLDLEEQPGRSQAETIAAHCEDRRLLLVLDNCEHLVDACAELAVGLLRDCPELHLIATSREPLNVPGEVVWSVPPLVPEDAERLFGERARAHAPRFQGDGEGDASGAVAEICRRLEGIPLAIELAAARVAVMSPPEIVKRLGDRAGLLGGGSRTAAPRQRTLEGAIDWSYQLLSEPERELFRRVCVFPAAFSLEAVEEVCAGSIDLLAKLVAKSLVQQSAGRYECLDVIRGFGRDRLEGSGELDRLRERHAEFFLQLAADREAGALARWLDRLEIEQGNFRAALAWSLGTDPETGVRLAHSLYEYWLDRGHVTEARHTLGLLLDRLPDASPLRRTALLDAGSFAYSAGDLDSARTQLVEALELPGPEAEARSEARCRLVLGVTQMAAGELAEGEAQLDRALALSRGDGDRRQEAEALHHLGVLVSVRQDLATARRLFEESIALREELGRVDESGATRTFLAAVALLQSDVDTARRSILEALQIALDVRDRRAAWSLDVLACLEVVAGRPERALRLAGAAGEMFEQTGQRPPAGWRLFTEPMLGRAREQLGTGAAQQAWEAGRGLGFEDALAEALELKVAAAAG